MEGEPLLAKQEKPLLDTQHNSIPSSLFTYLYVGQFLARWGARFISHFLSLLCLQLHSHYWVFLLYFFIKIIYIFLVFFGKKNTCAELTSLLKIHNNFNILRLSLEIFETKDFFFSKILRLKLVLLVFYHFLLGLLNLKLFHCYCDILKIKSFTFNVLELFQTV